MRGGEALGWAPGLSPSKGWGQGWGQQGDGVQGGGTALLSNVAR